MQKPNPTTARLRPPTKIVAPSIPKIPTETKALKRDVPKEPLKSITTTTLKRKAEASSTSVTDTSRNKKTVASKTALKPKNENPSNSPPKKKKRPAWDVKGRLEDLEKNHASTEASLNELNQVKQSLTEQLNSSQSTIEELLSFKESLETKVQVKEKENDQMTNEMEELRQKLKDIEISFEQEKAQLKSCHASQVDELEHKLSELQKEKEMICKELDSLKLENSELRSCIATQSASALMMETQVKSLRLKNNQADETIVEKTATIDCLERETLVLKESLEQSHQKLQEAETVRRQLHNMIQELKGNIRVFCRVRPLLDIDKEEGKEFKHISFPENDDSSIIISQCTESASGSVMNKDYPFTFDKVFTPNASQEEVFQEISQLVQSALDGYNVCIFAYGQTGSGKTFTMEGPTIDHINDETMGMIPRAVEQIYRSAEKLKEKGWKFDIEGQFLEIYNETIRDLIGVFDANKKHDIKHTGHQGKTYVTDATVVKLDSPDQVKQLLLKASENRAVASTNCNERSSRSHSVFTLRIAGTNQITQESLEGTLNLIDLAGSERLSVSGSTGDRLKETQAINKSLSSLADVITSLSNKDSHIPYRNSKLTYLLQNSLGGNSKTLMFVNLSPLSTNFQESLCSLRFATKVNACQIGTAKRISK